MGRLGQNLYFYNTIIIGVPTSIGVQESTRDLLERLKRDLGAASLDATLVTLLAEHHELKARAASDRLLKAITGKRAAVARFARSGGIRSLSVFGSAVHGDARPGSDLDLLVDFERGRTPGLIRLGALERELSRLLGVPVDLQTPGSLSEPMRSRIRADALEIDVAP